MKTLTSKTYYQDKDFNLEDIAKSINSHDKVLCRIDTNKHFAETFLQASKKSKDIDTALKRVILELLENDAGFRSALSKFIRNNSRNDFKTLLRRASIFVGGILATIFSGIIVHYFTNR